MVSLMGMPYTVLLPVIAREVLGGGAGTLGALTAASGLGALMGALYLASRKSVLGLGRVIAAAAAVFGVGLVGFSRVDVALARAAADAVDGRGDDAPDGGEQHGPPDHRRRGQARAGDEPLRDGGLRHRARSGACSRARSRTGWARRTRILVGGVVCVVAAAVFLRALPELRRGVRPIYVRLGIVPEVAPGRTGAVP